MGSKKEGPNFDSLRLDSSAVEHLGYIQEPARVPSIAEHIATITAELELCFRYVSRFILARQSTRSKLYVHPSVLVHRRQFFSYLL
jgi:hypothetical protein